MRRMRIHAPGAADKIQFCTIYENLISVIGFSSFPVCYLDVVRFHFTIAAVDTLGSYMCFSANACSKQRYTRIACN